MTRTIYTPREDNEWVKPTMRRHKIACCDCGLVHVFEFKVVYRAVWFRAKRDNRATAARRRESRKGKR